MFPLCTIHLCQPRTRAQSPTSLETFFSEITLCVVPAVVVCDFNIHDPSKAYKLIDLLGTFGLIQHMTTPTHIHGHILDVVIRRAVDQSVASVRVKPMSIADHHCIDCVLAMSRPSMPPLMFLSETFVSCKFYISWTILPTSANSCPKGILKTLNRWLMIMTQFSERSLKDTPQGRTGWDEGLGHVCGTPTTWKKLERRSASASIAGGRLNLKFTASSMLNPEMRRRLP